MPALQTLDTLTYDAVWYLIRRGLPGDAVDLARRLYQHRLDHGGPDDRYTLNAATTPGRSSV